MLRSFRHFVAIAVFVFASAFSAAEHANARNTTAEFKNTLSAGDLRIFENYQAERSVYDFKLDAYWREVSDKRALRRKRKRGGLPLRDEDYVQSYPPEYSGPNLPSSIKKRWTAFLARGQKDKPKKKSKGLPDLKDFLAMARKYYDFIPERIPEREFKKRYAREALKLGLTKHQVVRIYALETSGLGTADMVAGIHPISRKGRPISTAMGYAQLLAANTINELRKNGKGFIKRLQAKARRNPEQAETLERKISSLRRMVANAYSIPHSWSRQVAYSRTGKGLGMHAINIDGDIGPWLQVVKIKGLKLSAERNGRKNLSGSQIELMNLAGPGTGLEMMRTAGMGAPTTNFFARRAYYRNTIVRGKTSKELIAALDERMNQNMKNSGAREFVEIFDELLAERQAQR